MAATTDDYELELVRAQIANLNAENSKLQQETRYPPVIVAAMVIGVISPLLAAVIVVFSS
jgi:hypothetical protein